METIAITEGLLLNSRSSLVYALLLEKFLPIHGGIHISIVLNDATIYTIVLDSVMTGCPRVSVTSRPFYAST